MTSFFPITYWKPSAGLLSTSPQNAARFVPNMGHLYLQASAALPVTSRKYLVINMAAYLKHPRRPPDGSLYTTCDSRGGSPVYNRVWLSVGSMNRAVVAKYRACVPDGVVGIFLVKDILDALGHKVSAVALMQDVAVFEMANMETTESVVQSVSTCACSTVLKTL